MTDAEGYLSSKVSCNICTYEWIGVYPVSTDEGALECGSCGAQDSTVLGRVQRDGSYVEEDE